MSGISRCAKRLKTRQPAIVVRDVARCQNLPTQAIVLLACSESGKNRYLRRLVEAGLIATVLQLLARCEDENFADVLGGDGDLPCPAVWLQLLHNTVSNVNMLCQEVLANSRMEIARGIGPVVRCMTDECQRMFFGENKYWWHGRAIFLFVDLLGDLVMSLETVPILIQYEGLVEFLIQCLFWGKHRPDIVEESHKYAPTNTFEMIQHSALIVLQALTGVDKVINGAQSGKLTDEEIKHLQMIASTKIVIEKYNPDSKMTFAAGWFELRNASSDTVTQARLWLILYQLILGQCVDRAMVVRMVKYGVSNVKSNYDSRTISFLYMALTPLTGVKKLNDDLYSVAIKAGLIELILKLIVLFDAGGTRDFRIDFDCVNGLLVEVSAVSLSKKSAKALNERRAKIQEELRGVVGKTKEHSRLVEKVRSIVSRAVEIERTQNSDGSDRVFCGRCFEAINADKIKTCSKCHRRKCLSFA